MVFHISGKRKLLDKFRAGGINKTGNENCNALFRAAYTLLISIVFVPSHTVLFEKIIQLFSWNYLNNPFLKNNWKIRPEF